MTQRDGQREWALLNPKHEADEDIRRMGNTHSGDIRPTVVTLGHTESHGLGTAGAFLYLVLAGSPRLKLSVGINKVIKVGSNLSLKFLCHVMHMRE